MNRPDFDFLAALLKRRSGLSFSPDKSDFLESRLRQVAERHGFRDVPHLVRELKADNEPLVRAVTESATTHDTRFFRDAATFRFFSDTILRTLLHARRGVRRLRIWCAGCSTGQEAYSLAMIVDGIPRFGDWQIDIIASDINAGVVAKAREGRYIPLEITRGLPAPMLAKYFNSEGAECRVKKSLRERVEFRVVNLVECFASLGRFDVIFCRNVLIYFDSVTKANVLERLIEALAPDGYLVVGSSETAVGLNAPLAAVSRARGVYAKTGASFVHPAMD